MNSTNLIESFSNYEVPVSYTAYHTQMLESIYLGDSSNKQLNIPGHSIREILYGYLLKGTLKIYPNDSMNFPLTKEEFKYNASQLLNAYEVVYGLSYKNGDTILVNKNYNGSYRNEYYIVQKDFTGVDFYNDYTLLDRVAVRCLEPLMPIEALDVIELYQYVTFDSNGNNKKYALECLALHVAANAVSNIKGIQYPICFVRWDELRKLLLKDRRASFKYEGHKMNLVDLLENREFLSSFLKTGYIEIGE